MDRWFSSWNPKFKSLSILCHWTEILWIQFVDKPENISIDSVALPFEALRIKKGFILEIYNVEWNEYLPLNIWMLNGASKTPFNSISEANNWLYAIQKENEMGWKNWHYNSRHSHENDGAGWLCLELWLVWGIMRPRLRLRLREQRRDQQLEGWLRGSESQGMLQAVRLQTVQW